MDTRRSDGRDLWLRVYAWLRKSAWVPPGLALAWLATLATIVRSPAIMVADWGATVSLVLLVGLLARWHASRRNGSPGTSPPEAGPTGSASGHTVSLETVPTGTTRNAAGQPATAGESHPPVELDGKDKVSRVGATGRPALGTMAPAHAPVGTGPALTDKPPSQDAAGLITPGLQVLTAEEVARVLRVDLALVISSITNGELPGNRIGSYWRIDQAALTQWLRGSYEAPLRNAPGH